MQQPATTAIVPPTTVLHAQQGGCSCAVPPNVSCHVRGARGATITTIVVHVVALLAFGWLSWGVWLASMISFIMGGVLLCKFTKCTYIATGSLFILACIFDLVAMATWISFHMSGGRFFGHTRWLSLLGLPAALGAVSFIIAIVCIFVATCSWEQSGALDAMGPPMPGVAQVMAPSHGIQMKQHAPQGQPQSVGNPQAPPTYSETV